MTTILFWAIAIALARLVRYVRTKPPGRAQRGLCAGCAFVHMQYGATGRNAVFCTFGGGVREVKLDVLLHGLSEPEHAASAGADWIRAGDPRCWGRSVIQL